MIKYDIRELSRLLEWVIATNPGLIVACFVFSELERSNEIRIIYVPSHLYHMLFELFKNSMRAVMEHHGEDSDNYPAVEVMLVRGKEDICVKVR